MEIWIISYVIQIGLGIYGYLKMPVRTSFDEKLRRVVLSGAWLPCLFFSVFYQVVAIGIYHLRGARLSQKEASAAARLQSSFDSGSPAPARRPSTSETNPFEGGGGPTSQGPNPFGQGTNSPAPQDPPQSDNPFG